MTCKFLQKLKITDDKKVVNPLFDFSITWLPSNEDMLVSGDKSLGVVSKNEEGEWSLSLQELVCHENSISALLAISEEILFTYSMDDKLMKIWRFGDDCQCIWTFRHSVEITSMCYSENNLAFQDFKGSICVLQGDFTKTQ